MGVSEKSLFFGEKTEKKKVKRLYDTRRGKRECQGQGAVRAPQGERIKRDAAMLQSGVG